MCIRDRAGRQALADAVARLQAAGAEGEGLRPVGDASDPVREALLTWRAVRAKAAGVSHAAVLDDDTLDALSEHRPADAAALSAVPGLGAARAARYGPEIIDLIAEYAR